MKWFKILTMPGKILRLLKEAKEAFDIVSDKVQDPEVLKEIEDVREALKEFS